MPTAQLNDSLFNNISTKCEVVLVSNIDAGLACMSIFLLSNFVVGLPTNAWVIWLICRGTREQLASELYLLSLAVCEMLYYSAIPVQLYCMYSFEDVSDGLAILLIIQWILVWVGRPIFQTSICVERYIAVVHPLIFIRLKPLKYKVAQCALTWCIFFLTLLFLWTLPVEIIGWLWFVPTWCTLMYCYLSVLYTLKRPGPGEREGEERRRGDKMKRKAFNIILVHLACFLVNYLPTLIAQNLRKQIHISSIVLNLMNLGIVCGHVQPLLYLHRAGKLCCVKRALT